MFLCTLANTGIYIFKCRSRAQSKITFFSHRILIKPLEWLILNGLLSTYREFLELQLSGVWDGGQQDPRHLPRPGPPHSQLPTQPSVHRKSKQEFKSFWSFWFAVQTYYTKFICPGRRSKNRSAICKKYRKRRATHCQVILIFFAGKMYHNFGSLHLKSTKNILYFLVSKILK